MEWLGRNPQHEWVNPTGISCQNHKRLQLLEHDYKTASKTDFALIKAAAESGDPKSMYMYGVVVMAVQKDASTGKTWIRRAAAEGYPDAMLYIGKME